MKRILLLCAVTMMAFTASWAQRTVTGTVSGEDDGTPVPGVNVIVKGTSAGTVTDIDGNYQIGVPDDGGILVFSFIGLTTEEVEIGNQSKIDMVMTADIKQLTEIVVTGYGIEREAKELTYQTETVDTETLMVGQATNSANALIGKVAGLTVNAQDNGVNPNSQILLRGLRSVSGNNEALIVIDGSIASTGAFNDLNPNDIESISVLKGASAAAIYGSGAANGALMVTTKRGGKAKKFTAGITHNTTVESVAYMPDFQTEYGTGWDGEYNNIENTNWGPRFDGTMRQIGPTFPDGYALPTQMVPYAPVKDNLKDFYNEGMTHNTTAYLSGGDETGGYYMSLGYLDRKGIVPDDEYNRITAKFNASKKIGDVKLTATTNFATDNTDVVGSTIGDQDRPLYWFVLNTPANIPLSSYKDWDNPESYGYADNYYNAFYQNPYWGVGTNRNIDQSNRFTGNMAASWDIVKQINFTAQMGVNTVWGHGKNWRAEQTYDEVLQPYHSTVSSFVTDSEFQTTTYTGQALLTGNFNLNSDFTLKAILGATTIAGESRNSSITANNLSIPDFYDISNGTGQLDATVDEWQKRTYGFFGDFTFGYKNWAYLTLTGRQDYTSTLPPENNSYFYPSIGANVVLTDAISGLQSSVLSYLKVTVSNSTVYNDLGPYQINERYSQSSSFPYGSLNGFYKSNTAVDSDIKKEKLNTTEIGLNMSFLDSRIDLDGAYFMTKTTDLITYTTPSRASGASSYLTNIGALSGTGFEITLGGDVVRAGDFVWRLDVNYFTNTTIVDEVGAGLDEITVEGWTGYGTYAIEGEAFPYLKAVGYERDPQGRVIVEESSGNPLVGTIQNQGRTTPKHTVGLTTSFNWKGINLAAVFDYRGGDDYVYFAQGMNSMEFTGRSMESVSSNRQDFVWPNSVINTGTDESPVYVENTNIQITDGIMQFWQNRYNEIKENYVRDATAAKIRELSLSYTLPKSLTNQWGWLQTLTVGIIGRNLYTWLPEGQTRFSDPEFRNAGGTGNGIGIGGYFTSPPTRSVGFNINVEF